jgi:hypothetical protein
MNYEHKRLPSMEWLKSILSEKHKEHFDFMQREYVITPYQVVAAFTTLASFIWARRFYKHSITRLTEVRVYKRCNEASSYLRTLPKDKQAY